MGTPAGPRHLPGLSSLLCASFLLTCELEEARVHILLTRSVCYACRVVRSWSSPSDARAGHFVRCDSSHVMSQCIGIPARAGGLIALLCILCVFFGLLLISDVESALSMLAAVRACSLWLRSARRLCRVVSVGFQRQDGEVGGHIGHVGRCR